MYMDVLNGCNTRYIITIFSIIILLYNIYFFSISLKGEYSLLVNGLIVRTKVQEAEKGHSLSKINKINRYKKNLSPTLETFLPLSWQQFSPQKFYPFWIVLSNNLLFGEIERTNDKEKSWQIQGQYSFNKMSKSMYYVYYV